MKDPKNFVKSYKLRKKDSSKIKMDKDEFIREHKKLVNVLESPSHADDKAEAKKQKKELKEVQKSQEGNTYDFNDTKAMISTTAQAHAESTASPALVEYLKSSINADLEKIRLSKGTLTVYKKEAGIYGGFFQDEFGQVVQNFDNMSIPMLAKNLELKGYYNAPVPVSAPVIAEPVKSEAKHEDEAEDKELIQEEVQEMLEQHNQMYHQGQKPGEPIRGGKGYVRIKYGDFELEIKKSMQDFINDFKGQSKVDIRKAISAWRRNSHAGPQYKSDLDAARALLSDWEQFGEEFNQILFALKMKHGQK